MVYIDIKKSIEKNWVSWMKNEHIPEIINLKLFQKNELLKIKISDKNYSYYCVKYYTKSLVNYNLYQKKYAQKIQKKHFIKYQNQFHAKREILQLIYEH